MIDSVLNKSLGRVKQCFKVVTSYSDMNYRLARLALMGWFCSLGTKLLYIDRLFSYFAKILKIVLPRPRTDNSI